MESPPCLRSGVGSPAGCGKCRDAPWAGRDARVCTSQRDYPHLGAAEGDAVAASGRFGLNPDVNKNFEHFSTEKWTSPEGERYEASHGHSEYLSGPESKKSVGKTSTYNIGRIMSGNGMAAEEK